MPTSEAWALDKRLQGRMNVALSNWNNVHVRREKPVGTASVETVPSLGKARVDLKCSSSSISIILKNYLASLLFLNHLFDLSRPPTSHIPRSRR